MVQPTLDAGVGQFEASCNFGCDNQQFCDILPLEQPCLDAGPGIYFLAQGLGVCAPIVEDFDAGTTCTDSTLCGEGLICTDVNGGSLCTLDAGPSNGDCQCQDCADNGEFQGSSCPIGCQGPVSDLRHCSICLCQICPTP